uniref:Bm8069 n=1 Tax=Brugia malayi TaxID=6279 RepID=A0A1I9G8K8_BRUMA|nr:Bm8069 [Brugia malayi]
MFSRRHLKNPKQKQQQKQRQHQQQQQERQQQQSTRERTERQQKQLEYQQQRQERQQQKQQQQQSTRERTERQQKQLEYQQQRQERQQQKQQEQQSTRERTERQQKQLEYQQQRQERQQQKQQQQQSTRERTERQQKQLEYQQQRQERQQQKQQEQQSTRERTERQQKQLEYQQRQERQQQKQRLQYQQEKCQSQHLEQLKTTKTKKDEINTSSGRISERLIIRTSTPTGQRLRYVVTRPFLSAEPRRPSYHSKCYHKCHCNDPSTSTNFNKNCSTAADILTNQKPYQLSSSINDNSYNLFNQNNYKIFMETLSPKNTNTNNDKSKSDVELITSNYHNQRTDKNSKKNTTFCSFARQFRETQSMNYDNSKLIFQSHLTTILPQISTINSKITTTNCLNNIDKSSLPVINKSRQKVKKCGVFYEQTQSLSPLSVSDKGMFTDNTVLVNL